MMHYHTIIVALLSSVVSAGYGKNTHFPACGQLNKCFPGGQGEGHNMLTGDHNTLPKCWYKFDGESDFGCYDPINNSCNNIKNVNMFDSRSCGSPSTPSVPVPAEPVTPHTPTSPSKSIPSCEQLNKCFPGGQGEGHNILTGDRNSLPKCWYKFDGESDFGCYDPINNSCNNIKNVNMFDSRSCGSPSTPSVPVPVKPVTPYTPTSPSKSIPSCEQLNKCFPGGQGEGHNILTGDRNSLPKCWYKFDGESEFGCYDPINNSCKNIKDVNMFDSRSCGSSITPSVPEIKPVPSPKPVNPYDKQACPDLERDICIDVNTGKPAPRTEAPVYWAQEDGQWKCSDKVESFGKFHYTINLSSPPAHCVKGEASPYECE